MKKITIALSALALICFSGCTTVEEKPVTRSTTTTTEETTVHRLAPTTTTETQTIRSN